MGEFLEKEKEKGKAEGKGREGKGEKQGKEKEKATEAIEARLNGSGFNSPRPFPYFPDIPPCDPFQVFWASFAGMQLRSVSVSTACYSKGAGRASRLSQPDVTSVTLPEAACVHLPILSPSHRGFFSEESVLGNAFVICSLLHF